MERRRLSALVFTCLLVLSILAVGLSIPVTADNGYTITIDDSVDTPTRDVELEGATYEISAIAKANKGDSIGVTVQAPDADQFYRVYLYNSERQIVKGGFGEGDKTVEFDLTNLTAGTYVFTVQQQGANQVIHPLVIKGYETSIDVPTSTARGEDVRVNVSIEALEANITHDRIEVVLAGQDRQVRETAVQSDGTYTATISTGELEPGSYDVYANVRGEQVVFDEQVIFGVSDAQSVKVEPTGSDSVVSDTTNPATSRGDEPTTSYSVAETQTQDEVVTPVDQSQQTTDTRLPGFGFVSISIIIIMGLVFFRSVK